MSMNLQLDLKHSWVQKNESLMPSLAIVNGIFVNRGPPLNLLQVGHSKREGG